MIQSRNIVKAIKSTEYADKPYVINRIPPDKKKL